jgi:hypothetical protein
MSYPPTQTALLPHGIQHGPLPSRQIFDIRSCAVSETFGEEVKDGFLQAMFDGDGETSGAADGDGGFSSMR